MAAKEISAAQLKVTGAAGKVLHRSLTKNKDYDGSAQGVPAGVNGEAKLSTVKVLSSEKGDNVWIIVSTSGIVTSPAEYRGRQVYPSYIYGQHHFSSKAADAEAQCDDAVKGMIRFMHNVGIPEEAIEKAKASSKGDDFMYLAVKTLEAHTAKNGTAFKFATQPQKNKPDRTEARALGPVDSDATPPARNSAATAPEAAAEPQGEKGGMPYLDEIWKHQGVECRVTAVNPSDGNETVTLEPLDGSASFEDLPWFDEAGNPQIEYVR